MIRQRHRQKGATMGLIVVCSLLLAILTVGLFQVMMIFGGSQELRNAVDAGALNVGKEAVNLKTQPEMGGGSEAQFADCVDTKGKIGLMNINRVLGKAFLMNANQAAMSAKSTSTGDSAQHANQAQDAAQAICDRITEQLKDKKKTQPFFNSFIKSNSIKMFGKAEVEADSEDWDTACVDRDEESNLRISTNQLPDGYSLPGDATKTIAEKGVGNSQFLKGYHGIAVNNKQLNFVPFRYDEKPHLINGFYYQANKIPVPTWTKPVPNALGTRGSTAKMQWNNLATAYVVANPQRQYQAAIPHGFIRVKLEKNKANWKYQGLLKEKETTYGYYPGQTQFHVRDAGSGTMNITATLGNQYIPPTLWNAIHAFGMPQHDSVNQVLLQRIREIKHDFSQSDLNSLLNDLVMASTLGMDEGEFYIFPTYTTQDKTNPVMKVARKEMVMGLAPWLKTGANADGQEKEIATESRPLFTSPNIVIMTMTGIGCKPGVFGATESGSLKWTPGTGHDGCLGTLRVQRETDIIYSGLCTIL